MIMSNHAIAGKALVIGQRRTMGYVALGLLRRRSALFTCSVKMVAIRKQFTPYLVLFLNIYTSFVSSLYFHIGETEKKCFIEEIPDETMIIGNYRTQLYDKQKEEYLPATQGLGMFVEVKDPDEKVILSRQYGSEGRFTFTSHTPGEHQICLHSNSSKFALFAGGMLRVHLDIQVGEHTNNYAEIAAKDKLSELQLRARQLMEQVDQVQKEQNYQRYREERFRQTSESTNQRVLWWSIIQTLILVAIGFWQMRHLKSFFEAKKLV
ncbi:transmembrane emp24 domain-containing protein 9-like [Myxocyprinus asiaticus]|uniref:transmembrane emp24 domain-containing protein 9-like n=1 Tax=Myxocyprinus asiaticus TaxID=70543 RepID=UPI00222171FD|nr:transmembrane emp24 domain-containing protein 9-like [Myxocyprinus asiaticus]